MAVLDQVDLKIKASGDLVYLAAEKGQDVKSGVLLVQIDTTDAKEAVEDAEKNLAEA